MQLFWDDRLSTHNQRKLKCVTAEDTNSALAIEFATYEPLANSLALAKCPVAVQIQSREVQTQQSFVGLRFALRWTILRFLRWLSPIPEVAWSRLIRELRRLITIEFQSVSVHEMRRSVPEL